ncbi:MAG: hypothetical protein V2B19_12755 [Pseudomonadota bacterium]
MAKKKNLKIPRSMRKKIQEHKRANKAINESQERLLQRAKADATDAGMELSVAPPTTEKMSEIIIYFAKPLLDAASNTDEQKKALTVAILIWNLSILPEKMQSKQKNKIKKLLNISNTDDPLDGGYRVVNFLIQRKKLAFPNINRMVMGYEIIDTPRGIHLNVTSNVSKNGINS